MTPLQMNHLLVLGILLGAVLLLGALGFFRPRAKEGFQAVQWLPKIATPVSGISMSGYNYGDLRITGATLVKVGETQQKSTDTYAVQLNAGTSGNEFVVAQGERGTNGEIVKLNMVLVEMSEDANRNLLMKATEAGSATTTASALTDSVVRSAWNGKTSASVADSDTYSGPPGIGLQNVIVRLQRSQTTGSPAAAARTQTIQRTVAASNSIIKCPAHYTFFNASNGDSLCCRGTVNPYTNQCSGTATNDICSLSGRALDPRNPTQRLNECRDLVESETAVAAEACPVSLPHLASAVKDGADNYKCCANPVALADGTNFTCSTEDLKDTSRYCIVDGKGVAKSNTFDGKMERMCSEGSMLDSATCPRDDLGREVFQKVNYVMGDREAVRYDISDLKGLTIPTCFRLNETCIPESAIDYAKKRGAYKEYDPKTWEYSCAVWSRKNRGEIVADSVKGYLYNPIGGASGPPSSAS